MLILHTNLLRAHGLLGNLMNIEALFEGLDKRPTAIRPEQGWTQEEMDDLGVAGLHLILERDLHTEPTTSDEVQLRQQILTTQQASVERGTVRWMEYGEDMLLYEPGAARSARQLIKRLKSVGSWGDLDRLLVQGKDVADSIRNYLWDLWMNDGLVLGDEDFDEAISSVEDLIEIIPPSTPLDLPNVGDDGADFNFVDPFDPWQMGVPWLIIKRYCGERSNMIGTWTASSREDLPSVQKTAKAIGWKVRKGVDRDFHGLW
jgi:hypothetical protein